MPARSSNRSTSGWSPAAILEALNRTETQEYIHARIAAVGGQGPQIFPAEACQSVYKATDGVPRLINQVCDHALLLAYAAGQTHVGAGADRRGVGRPAAIAHPLERAAAAQRQYHRIRRPGRRRQRDGLAPTPTNPPPTRNRRPRRLRSILVPEPEDIDETEVADLEASEQLRQIQEMLADVEHEFCPAGSIGPEVELVFDDAAHPFQEAFQHEEVIKDRYAAPSAATASGAVPDDACLSPAAQSIPSPTAIAAAETEPWFDEETLLADRPLEEPEKTLLAETKLDETANESVNETIDENTGCSPAEPWLEPSVEDATEGGLQQPLASVATPRQPAEASPAGSKNADEEFDQGVDDGTTAKPTPSIAVVRRHEFGRLFAKLRQG